MTPDKDRKKELPSRPSIEDSRHAWQESMQRQIGELRQAVQIREAEITAALCGGTWSGGALRLDFWSQSVEIRWPELQPRLVRTGANCSTSDTGMLLYYLKLADGEPLADRWITFRELPGGGFYHQAFQGYSGNRVSQCYDSRPADFQAAAHSLGGWPLTGINEYAFAFQPLPRLRLAAVLWPGDEEFPGHAAILFDAAASHYLPIDGLAGLGANLAGRLCQLSIDS